MALPAPSIALAALLMPSWDPMLPLLLRTPVSWDACAHVLAGRLKCCRAAARCSAADSWRLERSAASVHSARPWLRCWSCAHEPAAARVSIRLAWIVRLAWTANLQRECRPAKLGCANQDSLRASGSPDAEILGVLRCRARWLITADCRRTEACDRPVSA